MEVKLSYRR
ncbi:unnamed protein product, partial [Allacma fusca]